jgi:hypothetical protein
MSVILLASCSVSRTTPYKNRRSQANDYSQCWCLDAWNGGAEWCCPGSPPKYMNPYAHSKGYNRNKDDK